MRVSPLNSIIFSLVLLSHLSLAVFGIGENLEDMASTSSSKGHDVQLEPSYMGPYGTKRYVRQLNSRFRDWEISPTPLAHTALQSEQFVAESVPFVHRELLQQRQNKGLLYLGSTPDGRKVHALFLESARGNSPNVAIVSTPKVWKSLSQKVQLHNFATVHKQHHTGFERGLHGDFNAAPLDSFIRRLLPKTPQSQFDDLLPRFPH